MNICFVFFSYGVWGGAEATVYQLTRKLRDRGQSVSIILNEEILPYYNGLEHVNILNIGPLYHRKMNLKRNRFYRLLLLPYSYVAEVLRHQYLLKKRKDILRFVSQNHVEVITALLEVAVPFVSDLIDELRALGIATSAILTGEPYLRGTQPVPLSSRPLNMLTTRWFKKALRQMDKVMSPTEYAARAWAEQGISFRNGCAIISQSIDLREIQNKLIPASELSGRLNLLFPGGGRFIKGGDLIVKALPKIRQEISDIHLYIALDVPKDHMLRKMVVDRSLEENVTFVGFLPVVEYRKLLNSVDMLVAPSRDEAAGTVFLEAMALGKPIVAGNTGGIPEIVENGRNGILVEPDPDQIADAILHLYLHEDVRRRISQNNLEDVTRFDSNHVIDRYIEVYRELVSAKVSGVGDIQKD